MVKSSPTMDTIYYLTGIQNVMAIFVAMYKAGRALMYRMMENRRFIIPCEMNYEIEKETRVLWSEQP